MNKKSILLVEDDRMVASLLSFRLKKHGYHVVTQLNEAMLFNTLKFNKPDIVVFGLSSSSYAGLNFVERIEKELQLNIPTIIAVSKEQQKKAIASLQLNVDGIIEKPVVFEDLMKLISSILYQNIDKSLS
ncbi:response regulator [Galbibacter sp. PAP.153]|uniref:response regulator n=1 Tax=Galbibacter sp. PAP.153 TaxID=3104623 RepID=UPI00300823A0